MRLLIVIAHLNAVHVRNAKHASALCESAEMFGFPPIMVSCVLIVFGKNERIMISLDQPIATTDLQVAPHTSPMYIAAPIPFPLHHATYANFHQIHIVP